MSRGKGNAVNALNVLQGEGWVCLTPDEANKVREALWTLNYLAHRTGPSPLPVLDVVALILTLTANGAE